jgi:glucose/mannose-6-phosphate isomerase
MDSGNMIEVLKKFPEMLKEALSLGDDISFQKEFIENIAVLGMGGSGYTGDLLKTYLESDIPIFVFKDYKMPKFIGKNSLVFAASYSGNTEETISAYRLAINRGCKIVSISAGGKLEELARLNKNPHILLPKGIQPRLTTPYQFVAILNVLVSTGLIEEQESIINACAKDLKNNIDKIEGNAKELASKVKGKVPIIYASEKMSCIAEKWKTDVNENAKTHAFYNMFSEFNHNEICAYENPVGNFHVIIISDEKDHDRIKKRIDIFKKLLKEYKTPVTEVSISGKLMTRLMSNILMGLFFAYNLALEYDIDPTPVKIIEKLKKDLK